MAKVLFSDNATATLATGISSGGTSAVLNAGQGALFPTPNPTTGTYFFATFVAASNPNTREIVTCTARTTDTCTISPTSVAWSAGDTFALLQPAEVMEVFAQLDDLQAQLGNYAIDTGAANAYVVTLTPALSAPIAGTPIRWLAGHANTGASTFNGQPLVRPNGTALQANDVLPNCLYESSWNSTSNSYQLFAVFIGAFSQLTGQVTNAQVPYGVIAQYLEDIWDAPALTGNPSAPTAIPSTNNTQIATTAFANAAAAAAVAALISGGVLNPTGHWPIGQFLVQWGSFVSTGGNVPVNFSEDFAAGCFGVQFTPSVGGFTAGLVGTPSTENFTADTSRLGSGVTVWWFAYGK